MASRKEQKEALKREREERERQAKATEQRKRLVGFGVAGGIVLVAIVVIVVLVAGGGDGGQASADVLPDGGTVPQQKVLDFDEAIKAAGCDYSTERAKARTHLTDPSAKVDYSTNPPTSGRHYEVPAEDGAYSEAPPDTTLVHTLEHGRVILWFDPALPEADRADLKALFDEDSYQMVLVPRANMPYAVALSAWNRDPLENGTGRLLTCEEFTPAIFDAIRTFRDENRGQGPEPIP